MHADAGKGCSDRALQHAVLRSGCCALLGTRRGWGDGGWSCHLRDGSRRGLPAFGDGDGWLGDPLTRGDGAWGWLVGVMIKIWRMGYHTIRGVVVVCGGIPLRRDVLALGR